MASPPLPPAATARIAELVDRHDAVALYGSRARGDASARSDVDLLAIGTRPMGSATRAPVSVTIYEESHLIELARAGSVFVLHLKNESLILSDKTHAFSRIFGSWRMPDFERTLAGMRAAAAVLDIPRDAAPTRELAAAALFVLRSVVYLRCLERGQPAFGIEDVTQVLRDTSLQELLQAARSEELAPRDVLLASRVLLERYLGQAPRNPFGSLEALAVSCFREFPLASDLARRLATGRHPTHYATGATTWWA